MPGRVLQLGLCKLLHWPLQAPGKPDASIRHGIPKVSSGCEHQVLHLDLSKSISG